MSFPADIETLGGRLRYVREDLLNVSTARMAELLAADGLHEGATNASVTRYETGERTPGLVYVAAVARISGVPLDWIVLNRKGGEAGYIIDRLQRLVDELRAPIGFVASHKASGKRNRKSGKMRS